MADGSLARAFELDVKTLERRKEIIASFEALKRDDARGWLQFAEVYGEGRVEAEGCLDVLAVWLRDVVAAQAGAVSLVNADLLSSRRRPPSATGLRRSCGAWWCSTKRRTPSASATAPCGCSSSAC